MRTVTPSTAILRRAWNTMSKVPGGSRAFSKMVGKMAPYTGSIGARIVELRDGYGRAELLDRKQVRNHLDSVHAIALANFGEVISGVTMLYSLDPKMRAILTGMRIEYLKKARGTLTAECYVEPITEVKDMEITLDVAISNAAGEVVCRVYPEWKVGPKK
ncbi:MAG: acyl-coenzyme A thioesterase PaaI-like protein [Bradymonadia bacterium]|jgi:acyl-coenzyme A thioesterase PaaI-like protein